MTSLDKKIQHWIKMSDNFGEPVSLTYKGETQIKSTVGGLATILYKTVVFAFFIY